MKFAYILFKQRYIYISHPQIVSDTLSRVNPYRSMFKITAEPDASTFKLGVNL